MTFNTLKVFILAFLLIVYCSKSPTSPETGTLIGTVYLEGEQDHSGITVVYPVRYWNRKHEA